MPTLFIINGYRFFFFSNDSHEPKHIHVEKAEKYAKFWLKPIALASNYKFNSHELKIIENMLIEKQQEIEVRWNEYFRVS